MRGSGGNGPLPHRAPGRGRRGPGAQARGCMRDLAHHPFVGCLEGRESVETARDQIVSPQLIERTLQALDIVEDACAGHTPGHNLHARSWHARPGRPATRAGLPTGVQRLAHRAAPRPGRRSWSKSQIAHVHADHHRAGQGNSVRVRDNRHHPAGSGWRFLPPASLAEGGGRWRCSDVGMSHAVWLRWCWHWGSWPWPPGPRRRSASSGW